MEKVIIIAVVTPTVTGSGMLNGLPEAGDCLNGQEGNLRNSASPEGYGLSGRRAGIVNGVAGTLLVAAFLNSSRVAFSSHILGSSSIVQRAVASSVPIGC